MTGHDRPKGQGRLDMKNFMAIYTGSAAARSRWDALDEATRREREEAGMKAWEKWANDQSRVIFDGGAPLGRTKRVDANGVTDIRNQLAAYTIVQADSHEAAAKLFLNHPHFTIFPGEAVEVMECLPIPKM
jgi:hypothetical protein